MSIFHPLSLLHKQIVAFQIHFLDLHQIIDGRLYFREQLCLSPKDLLHLSTPHTRQGRNSV